MSLEELVKARESLKRFEEEQKEIKHRIYNLERDLFFEEEKEKLEDIKELETVLIRQRYVPPGKKGDNLVTCLTFDCPLMKYHKELRNSLFKKTVENLVYQVVFDGHVEYSSEEKLILEKYYLKINYLNLTRNK